MPDKKAAFFDFDKTLLGCESSRLLIRYMNHHRDIFFKEKGISLFYILRVLLMNELYKRHLYSDEKMALLLISFFKGRKLAVFEGIAEDFYLNYIKPNLAPNILSKLEMHRSNKHALVLVSAGTSYILKLVTRELGFDFLLCTELETTPDGLLTGRPKGEICIDSTKKILCEKLAMKNGIDLNASYAYGNHQSDIPMLELVGHASVVEPTGPLLLIAKKRGWPVLKFN